MARVDFWYLIFDNHEKSAQETDFANTDYIRGGKNMNILIWVGIVFVAVFLIIAVNAGDEEIEQLQRYWDIEIGMTEKEMLDIMGDGFDRSLLKNNCIKYEWRINVNSRHSRVKRVAIYTKDGFVEEVKPYNVQ